MNPTITLKIEGLNMKCCGGGKIVGFYLHPQNDYFETGLLVFGVSLTLNSVMPYLDGRSTEHHFFLQNISAPQ